MPDQWYPINGILPMASDQWYPINGIRSKAWSSAEAALKRALSSGAARQRVEELLAVYWALGRAAKIICKAAATTTMAAEAALLYFGSFLVLSSLTLISTSSYNNLIV